jgi:surface antigen
MKIAQMVMLSVAGVCLATGASSQINPFRGSQSARMTNEDITALRDASNRLLNQSNLKKGEKEIWRSTGTSGTVTAGNPAQRQGLACRILDYTYTMSSEVGKVRNGTLTWCKTGEGWKVS